MEENLNSPLSGWQPKRPSLLSVLCVLTFIGSGFSAFGNFIIMAMRGTLLRQMEDGSYDELFSAAPSMQETMEQMLSQPWYYWLGLVLLYAASVTGAAFMWKLRRNGFHIYTIAQCLLLIMSIVFNRAAGFPWSSLVITAAFVGMYASNLKYMPGKDDILNSQDDNN